jgi:hypothetical protein
MAARRFWRELYGIYLPQRKNVSVVPQCLASGLCRVAARPRTEIVEAKP